MEKPVDVEKLMNYLIGQVIKNLKANPEYADRCVEPTLIRKILEEMLEEQYQRTYGVQTSDTSTPTVNTIFEEAKDIANGRNGEVVAKVLDHVLRENEKSVDG